MWVSYVRYITLRISYLVTESVSCYMVTVVTMATYCITSHARDTFGERYFSRHELFITNQTSVLIKSTFLLWNIPLNMLKLSCSTKRCNCIFAGTSRVVITNVLCLINGLYLVWYINVYNLPGIIRYLILIPDICYNCNIWFL